jgi:predicted DNA-binding antitoxin AbrB/MazE fold protein
MNREGMCGTIALMRFIEAQFESGLLRPSTPLALRPGERVRLIIVRHPDPKRWDMARLAKTYPADESVLTEQGLGNWAADLDEEDRR